MMEHVDFAALSCRDFVDALASASPTPGGGGAAALVGAIGAALGGMVASLTLGKKKYAAVEAEIRALSGECASLRAALTDQIRADAEGFAPLAAAYAIPKDDPCRASALEAASYAACAAPMEILSLCARGVRAAAALAEKGSRLAVSDAACGAVCLRAAAQSAALNVFINTKGMLDRKTADELNARTENLLSEIESAANEVYARVSARLK